MPAIEHPLLAEADAFIAALLAFEASIPEPSRDAGALDPDAGKLQRRRPIRPLGTVIVPGSGQHVDPNVATITTPSKPKPNATNVNTNSGGGGGGGW